MPDPTSSIDSRPRKYSFEAILYRLPSQFPFPDQFDLTGKVLNGPSMVLPVIVIPELQVSEDDLSSEHADTANKTDTSGRATVKRCIPAG